ncbi:MAG: hemerythrin domain-containing protein [Peptococcaceae bacterium]|nr:hemerythrin domain-containing protein [Candidatus Syntrophopropionicum ammoniitolerans]
MYRQKIREQHQEIKGIINELREDVYSAEDIPENTIWIALKLGQLNAVLQAHLKFEDEFLYPCLKESNHQYTAETATKFSAEMGGLAQKFDAYIKQYIGTPHSIRQDLEKFVQDTATLIDKISTRIEAEDKELYELLNTYPVNCAVKKQN